MAGKPQPTTRRSPPTATQAEGLATASRDAATTDWGLPAQRRGLRGEIKLALLLIITLGGAFGYIVHRKFDALRKEAIAAEETDFKPLVSQQDPRQEIFLPTAASSEPEPFAADPNWSQHNLSQQAAADPPPLLAVQSEPPLAATSASSDPFPSTATPVVTQGPFPEVPPQSEPVPTSAEPAWAPLADSAPTAAESLPFPETSAATSSSTAEPFTVVSEATTPAPATAATSEPPVDLFGPLPATATPAQAEPTFDAADSTAATSPTPFPVEEPAFAPAPPATSATTPDPLATEPAFAPVSSAPATLLPPTSIAADDPFGRPTAPQPAAAEPSFGNPPPVTTASDDPFTPLSMPAPTGSVLMATPTGPVSNLVEEPFLLGVEREPAPLSTEPAFNNPPPATPSDRLRFSSPSVAASTPLVPDREPAPTVSGSDNLYTIRPGDNYWGISKAHYGSVRYFAALTEYNRDRIGDPQKMRPGMQVAIPEATALELRYPQLFTGTVPSVATTQPTVITAGPGEFFVSGSEPMYRVGEGDTLSSIAQKHLGRASRWEQVYTINRDVLPSPDRLKPGTVLRLPRDASQIAVTPEAR